MPEQIPNFVGQTQGAAPFLLLAIMAALAILTIENWPAK